MLDNVEVGDRITVRRGDSPATWDFRTVAKVTKTSITDSSGDRWTKYGEVWGSGQHGHWSSNRWSAVIYQPEDETRRDEAKAQQRMKHMRYGLADIKLWNQVPDELVEQVNELVKDHRVKGAST